MISSYLKIALRNLIKRKGYTILNVVGLAIGITCCLLIFQYVAFEKSYDTFEPQTNQIVRLRLDSYQQGKLAWQSATSYPAFGPTLRKDFPEVEDYCRLIDANLLLSNDERNIKFKEEKGYLKTALDAPDKILLSENTAKKYFGNDDPLGKRLTHRDPDYSRTFEVTGV